MPRPYGTEAERLIVGRVRKPHGIRGELFVWLETDRPDAVFQPGRELLLGDASGALDGGSLTVEGSRPFKDGVLLRVAEHPSRTEETDALRGRSLLIPRDEVAPLEEDEIFYHDLPGMRIMVAGEVVGTVRDVYESSPADLLAVERPGAKEVLVPLIGEWVQRIDVQGRTLEMKIPPGLLDV